MTQRDPRSEVLGSELQAGRICVARSLDFPQLEERDAKKAVRVSVLGVRGERSPKFDQRLSVAFFVEEFGGFFDGIPVRGVAHPLIILAVHHVPNPPD